MKPYLAKLILGILLCATGLSPALVAAQPYPSRPVRIIVPYAPGGATDVVSRLIGQKMAEQFGQPVLVENKAGGSSNIGSEFVAKAPPDGHTLIMQANPLTVNPALFPKAPDPIKDFSPITLVAKLPLFVMVHSSVPANSLKELIALLKANPGKYNYGTPGNGAPGHLATEMFKSLTGTSIVHIPFRGAGPAATALLAGDIQIVFGVLVGLTEHIKSGRVKVLAVTTDTRSRFAPDVPTLSESGLPGFNMSAWLGMLGPAGMGREIVLRNRDAVAKALGQQNVQETLTAQGFEGVGSTPEEFLAFLQADVVRSAQIVKTAGVRAD